MSFYRDRVYPFLVDALSNPEPIRKVRERILPSAYGTVLEVGVGSGLNFAYYDPTKITKLYALEPNPGMIQRARARLSHTKLNVEFLDLPGERIPLEDGTVDTAVSTFTLCTIPDVVSALGGIRRVLKPGGTLIFFEHDLSPDPEIQRWQRRWEPIHYRVFQGLHLTRDTQSLIRQGGFEIAQIETAYISQFPKSLSYLCWGIARPLSSTRDL